MRKCPAHVTTRIPQLKPSADHTLDDGARDDPHLSQLGDPACERPCGYADSHAALDDPWVIPEQRFAPHNSSSAGCTADAEAGKAAPADLYRADAAARCANRCAVWSMMC